MQVYLVRHAHAGDRGDFEGPDRLRPLSEKGWKQAEGLVHRLGDLAVSRVMSSPYLRCVQTVEPLARARGLQIEELDSLAEGSDWRETLALAGRMIAPAVLCSQGDVIGGLVEHLVRVGLVKADDAHWQKGSTWSFEVEAGEIVSARYLAPAG